jgi:hypothetical protein
MARYNTSVKYQIAYNGLRAGALVQLGNYSEQNGAESAYQFDLGFDYAGFSVDAIYSHATDAVFLSSLGAPNIGLNYLDATIANVDSAAIAAKYKIGPFQVFAGYAHDQFSDPTDSYAANAAANGFSGVGGYNVPGNLSGLAGAKVTTNAYITGDKILQTAWVGGKYAILTNLDFAAGYYQEWQNNFTGVACSGTTKNCSGTLKAVSGMLDWRPWKRVDVYGGVMYSEATGGIANGYTHPNGTAWATPNNTAYTGGVRVSF